MPRGESIGPWYRPVPTSNNLGSTVGAPPSRSCWPLSRLVSNPAPRKVPVRPDEMAGVAARIGQEVVLVLRLCLPEVGCGEDLGDRLARPQAGNIDVGDGVFGDPLLLVAGVEDRRPIAAADVIALPVARAGVMNLEEEFEDLPIADARRIKSDLDRLGVVAVVAIGGVRDAAAGVADPRRQNSVVTAKQVLHAPKATTGQNGSVLLYGHPPPGSRKRQNPQP